MADIFSLIIKAPETSDDAKGAKQLANGIVSRSYLTPYDLADGVGLTNRGRQQAQALHDKVVSAIDEISRERQIVDKRVLLVRTSSRRSRETEEALIGNKTGIDVVSHLTDDNLMSRNYGEWDGVDDVDRFSMKYPGSWTNYNRLGDWDSTPEGNGESKGKTFVRNGEVVEAAKKVAREKDIKFILYITDSRSVMCNVAVKIMQRPDTDSKTLRDSYKFGVGALISVPPYAGPTRITEWRFRVHSRGEDPLTSLLDEKNEAITTLRAENERQANDSRPGLACV